MNDSYQGLCFVRAIVQSRENPPHYNQFQLRTFTSTLRYHSCLNPVIKECNVEAYHSVYLKRFGCVQFGPGGGRQHTGHGELSVLNSSCSTHIFSLKSTAYLRSNVSSIVSHISGCVNAIFWWNLQWIGHHVFGVHDRTAAIISGLLIGLNSWCVLDSGEKVKVI